MLTADRREAHVAAANAVLAGIAAADAICGLRLGRWSRGQDHSTAVTLLETASLRHASLTPKFKRPLAEKDAVHYSPNLVNVERATALVRHARALLREAETL